jgi:hypothetical protein
MPLLPPHRAYTIAKVKQRDVPFSYWPFAKMSRRMALQSTLFSTDPWAIMRHSVRSTSQTGARDEAIAVLEQAQDYYRAVTSAAVAASKPVLLYYCYLNIVKAFLLHRGKQTTYEKAQHGLSEQLPAGKRELLDAFLMAFPTTAAIPATPAILATATTPAKPAIAAQEAKINVFDDFLQELRGTGLTSATKFNLVSVMPQIVPGHRLWMAASGKPERFVSIQRIEFAQATGSNDLWVNVVLDKADLTRLSCSQARCVSESGLLPKWLSVQTPENFEPSDGILFQQSTTIPFGLHPSQELNHLADAIRPHLWSTILSVPPYRRYYLYMCPTAEKDERLPQLLSMYALMYYLGSITRYKPQHFDKIVEPPFGGFIQSCLEDQPRQFLYMMASEFAKQEVTQPALV